MSSLGQVSVAAVLVFATAGVSQAAPGDTELISFSPTTHHAAGGGIDSSQPISADGRFVVFESDSADLVADDTNFAGDVFVKDLATGLIERVSLRPSADSRAR